MWIFLVWNLVVFLIYGWDKYLAIKKKRRISEKMLLLLAVLFGGVGAFCGMQIFRHKTKHKNFQVIVPVVTTISIVVIIYAYYKLYQV